MSWSLARQVERRDVSDRPSQGIAGHARVSRPGASIAVAYRTRRKTTNILICPECEGVRVCRCWRVQLLVLSACWDPRLRSPRLRLSYLVSVSAHSWRILFTQSFGGMSSMPNWSVRFEICRWSASSAWSLKSRRRRA